MHSRPTLNAAFVTSTVALALIVITAFATFPALLAAAVGRGPSGADPSTTLTQLMQEHEQHMQTYEERFIGRSVFFRPPAPAAPPPPPPPPRDPEPEPEPEPEPKPDPGPPPPPPDYRGPAVAAILGDRVLFKGRGARDQGQWIGVGEERDGLKVLETNPPQSVRVAYQRGEYDVPLFNWDMPFFTPTGTPGQLPPGMRRPDDSPQPDARTRQRDRGRAVAVPQESASDRERARQHAAEQGIEFDNGNGGFMDGADPPFAPDDGSYDPQLDPALDPYGDPEFDPEADPEAAGDDPHDTGERDSGEGESDDPGDAQHDPGNDPEAGGAAEK